MFNTDIQVTFSYSGKCGYCNQLTYYNQALDTYVDDTFNLHYDEDKLCFKRNGKPKFEFEAVPKNIIDISNTNIGRKFKTV